MNEVPTYDWNSDETFLGTTRIRGEKADLYIDMKETDPCISVVRMDLVANSVTISALRKTSRSYLRRNTFGNAYLKAFGLAKAKGLVQ